MGRTRTSEADHTCSCNCCGCGANVEPAADRYLRLWGECDLVWFTGTSHTTVQRFRKEPGFPAPMVLPGRTVRWIPEHLRAWFTTRASGPAPASPSRQHDGVLSAGDEPARALEPVAAAAAVPVPRRSSGHPSGG